MQTLLSLLLAKSVCATSKSGINPYIPQLTLQLPFTVTFLEAINDRNSTDHKEQSTHKI